MKILVTGANGFVGKNLIATLKHAIKEVEVYAYDIDNTIDDLKAYTKDCDVVVHLAGVNRPQNPEEFFEGNKGFSETLCCLLREHNNKASIIVSSSIQALRDNDYGKSKKEGEDILFEHAKINDSKVYIYRLVNLFGKWCKPNYNSVIATWCYNINNDIPVQVNDPNVELELNYIDDVVVEFINAINGKANQVDEFCVVEPIHKATLKQIKDLLESFKESRNNLYIPDMSNPLVSKLYSTYLNYIPSDEFSYSLKMNVDNRGSFTEILKTVANGQVSVNISKPGITKGNHWHHSKNEKFLVVSGKGLIQFRDIFSKEVIDYYVSSDDLKVVDIPTGYTHNIINLGEQDMVTIMWANETFNPDKPDTYFEEVNK